MGEVAGGIGGAVVETAAEGVGGVAAPAVESAVDTAADNLASTIEEVENVEGVDSAFQQLAEGEVGGEAGSVSDAEQDIQSHAEAEDSINSQDQQGEADESATDTVLEQATDGGTDSSQADKMDGQDTGGKQVVDETSESGGTEEATGESGEIASGIESLNAEVNTLTGEIQQLKDQQAAIVNRINEAMTQIPGLELTIKLAMENASPSEKQKLGLLLSLLNLLINAAGIMIGAEQTNKKQKNNESRPAVQPKKDKEFTPIKANIGLAANPIIPKGPPASAALR
ncbi:MAG: hypothetical protein COX79_00390 [Candidatus Levybacteria bacterium CG_4_10_14_0_2_um_filter_36_16]|nr:MAG: hypothetical protein AUK12_04360 [Candidatus Levybacteria bacterium CG2_30_37_29]PIR79534.1 MAG: hypothetical protein COU26_00680 [Candidatus Levybacteria bacterium CG10_big_fil_rev_8_21_14_0_10_36_30]PIZ97940.1 MAG: hypothetical protein COX79_00390 [Candidatus Levybacteria bacterium CG_4_10_14_0_2_um_filter_36_16]PJA90861.1 MAG: hypothetical protein CO136_00290 [Candidatus Levybacteria bacterium CG_4_9_14_3_um_filter_36_7]